MDDPPLYIVRQGLGTVTNLNGHLNSFRFVHVHRCVLNLKPSLCAPNGIHHWSKRREGASVRRNFYKCTICLGLMTLTSTGFTRARTVGTQVMPRSWRAFQLKVPITSSICWVGCVAAQVLLYAQLAETNSSWIVVRKDLFELYSTEQDFGTTFESSKDFETVTTYKTTQMYASAW